MAPGGLGARTAENWLQKLFLDNWCLLSSRLLAGENCLQVNMCSEDAVSKEICAVKML